MTQLENAILDSKASLKRLKSEVIPREKFQIHYQQRQRQGNKPMDLREQSGSHSVVSDSL